MRLQDHYHELRALRDDAPAFVKRRRELLQDFLSGMDSNRARALRDVQEQLDATFLLDNGSQMRMAELSDMLSDLDVRLNGILAAVSQCLVRTSFRKP